MQSRRPPRDEDLPKRASVCDKRQRKILASIKGALGGMVSCVGCSLAEDRCYLHRLYQNLEHSFGGGTAQRVFGSRKGESVRNERANVDPTSDRVNCRRERAAT